MLSLFNSLVMGVLGKIMPTNLTSCISGYQRELNYRRSDHSFSAFGNSRPGSTWYVDYYYYYHYYYYYYSFRQKIDIYQ